MVDHRARLSLQLILCPESMDLHGCERPEAIGNPIGRPNPKRSVGLLDLTIHMKGWRTLQYL